MGVEPTIQPREVAPWALNFARRETEWKLASRRGCERGRALPGLVETIGGG
jgi:hypothetical protein